MTAPRPAVDVVIPTAGRRPLAPLLDALVAQRGTLISRILVVDDRRRRDGPLVEGRLADAVEVLGAPGRGPASARNVGWRAATADWVAFLDDDVRLDGAWAACLAADIGDDTRDDTGDHIGASQGSVRVPLPADRRPRDWERNVRRLEGARWITADMAVRRQALEAVGGFDERFPRPYREDSDLGLRLTAAGWRIVPGTRAVQHPPSRAPWWVSIRQQAGNLDDAFMAAKHGPGWMGEDRGSTRRRRHLALTATGVAALVAALLGVPVAALVLAAGWLVGTAEFAWARIAPGPHDPAEVAAMAGTSVVIPALATAFWLAGLVRARMLLRRPGPVPVSTAAAPASTRPGELVAPPLPRSLQVEVTAACNLRCPMCLVRYRPPVNRVTGSLSFERFRSLVEEMPDLADVTLQGLGEPLLAPDLVAMVRFASERGIRVGFNTNATVLTHEKSVALVDAGLDWLCISLDAATPSVYEAIRDGARFDRVARNVRGLLAAKRGAGVDRPDVSLVLVAMRRNLDEVERVVRLASEWGVASVSVQNLSHSFDDAGVQFAEIRSFTEREALWADRREDKRAAEAAFDRARTAADALGIRLHLPRLDEQPAPPARRRNGTPGCDWPWRAAYVNHDGGVQPCCMVMGEERASFGNTSDGGLAAVWSGPRATQFRAALLTDEPPEVCRGCSLYRGVF